MRSAVSTTTLTLCLAGLLLSPSVRAQQAVDDEAPENGRTRTLGGHTFLPSALVGQPFTASSVGSLTGFGYANLRLTPQSGSPVTYQLGMIAQGFDLQIGLAPWWSVRGAVTGQVLSGVNFVSVLDAGTSVSYAAEAGTTFSWAHRDRVRMGLSIDARYRPELNFNIANALVRSVLAGRIDASTLLTSSQALWIGAAWQVAVTPHRLIGFFGEMRYWHVLSKDGSGPTSNGQFVGGLGLSLDLHAVSPLPFGILGAWRVTGDVRGASDLSHDVSVGFYYTGRRHLVLGPEAAFAIVPVTPQAKVFTVEGVLVLRYYW